jgi:hypothetical protein
MGFALSECRHLTKTRLVTSAPSLAAVLRAVLLQHPAVELIVRVLLRDPGRPVTLEALAARAATMDEALSRAVFGEAPVEGQPRQIRSTPRFQLKAVLYDIGLIDCLLARGASGPQRPGGYDPRADVWEIGNACRIGVRIAEVWARVEGSWVRPRASVGYRPMAAR